MSSSVVDGCRDARTPLAMLSGVKQEQGSKCLTVVRELYFPKSVSFNGTLNHGVAMKKLLVLWCWTALVFLTGTWYKSLAFYQF